MPPLGEAPQEPALREAGRPPAHPRRPVPKSGLLPWHLPSTISFLYRGHSSQSILGLMSWGRIPQQPFCAFLSANGPSFSSWGGHVVPSSSSSFLFCIFLPRDRLCCIWIPHPPLLPCGGVGLGGLAVEAVAGRQVFEFLPESHLVMLVM